MFQLFSSILALFLKTANIQNIGQHVAIAQCSLCNESFLHMQRWQNMLTCRLQKPLFPSFVRAVFRGASEKKNVLALRETRLPPHSFRSMMLCFRYLSLSLSLFFSVFNFFIFLFLRSPGGLSWERGTARSQNTLGNAKAIIEKRILRRGSVTVK